MVAKKKTRRRREFGYLRTLPSGRIHASYTGPDLRRHNAPTTYDNATDAEGFLSAERRLIQLDQWTPPAERVARKAVRLVTLRVFAEQWLSERKLSPKTRAHYRALLDSRILPPLGNEFMTDLNPAAIRTWWAGLAKDDTPTRSAHSYALLRTILGTAVDDHLITVNPCQIKDAGKPPKRRELDLLTLDELDTVAAAMPACYRAAVPVAAWCGLRFGELIELRRKDIGKSGDLMVLRIRRAATLVDGKLMVGTPKTEAGVRDVVVPPHVATILTGHLERWTEPGPESLIFTTTRGLQLSASAFTATYKLALEKVGKPHVRVHDLRHVGAVLAAQAGATTKELMARLGHTTPEMSMRYQHVAAGRDAEIARKLSGLANGNGNE